MNRPLGAPHASDRTADTRSLNASSAPTPSTPALPASVREAPLREAQATPRGSRIHRRRWAIVHPLQIRMLRIVLAYSLTIFVMLAVPVFTPLIQALDNRSLSWQEKAVIANDLLNLHERYWPWALAAGLVLAVHCVHSMLAMYRVAGPLYRFKATFQQIGQGNLSIRTRLRKGDFLTPEADLVNQMAEQLQGKISAIKRVEATVALDVDQLQRAVTATNNPDFAHLVRKMGQDLAYLRSSLDVFRTDKGFTLIELILAVAIVGVLSSLAIPNYLGFLEKARIARTVAEINGIAKDILGYAFPNGQYPDTLAQIGWDQRLDPWGHPYQYYRLNCANPAFSRLDPVVPSGAGSEGLVLPTRAYPPSSTAHISLAVGTGRHQGLIRLIAQSGNASSANGNTGNNGTATGNGASANGGGSTGSAGNAGGAGGNGNAGNNGGGNGGGGGPPCGSIGQARKDRFLVPINSDFDLYSMGKDGQSAAPLTAQKSHDDIIRANDGGYYGLASNF